ncbi:hypothetical protein HDU84_002478 [Entophlyctis sp. JEL0112]|nr:hypothetical protein HDU84_002478 [Entophlyctis sp. JEL0112]
MKHSRNVPDGSPRYLKSTAVLSSELVKLLVCIAVYLKELPASTRHNLRSVLIDLFGRESESWKMLIPAFVCESSTTFAFLNRYYVDVVQNNLQYVAVENLDPATFQISYQLKILTTALFSVLMLNKSLSKLKWISLVLLTVGVALVQLQTDDAGVKSHKSASQNVVGLTAVAIACVLSGIAGVCLFFRFEKAIEFRAITDRLAVYYFDSEVVRESGFFHGYSAWTLGAIACQAFGGLLVSLVVKYADNILKGFATSVSIIVSAVASVFLFDFEITGSFVIGATVVLFATHLYGLEEGGQAYGKVREEPNSSQQ